jgi:hypothetical protein
VRLYIKIGTHPAEWRATYLRKAPKVGDVFKLRPKQRHQKATRVRCCEVSELGDALLYFVERF